MHEELRNKLPWFPAIDRDLCRADLRCLNVCPYDVFSWDMGTGHPVVAHPSSCLPGCSMCLDECDAGAISLPTKREVQASLKKIRSSDESPTRSFQL